MAELLDFSYDRFTPAEVKAAGRVGVIRYVASGRPDVSATKAEVDAFRAAGLVFCAVWQRGKTRPLDGKTAGVADAKDALTYTAGLGRADTDPVYFAVDFPPTAEQLPTVLAYFEGVASVLGWYPIGVYANAPTIDYLHARTPIPLFWLHNWGSAGRVPAAANLHQYRINLTLNGKAVDYDRSLTSYYGQWGSNVNELIAKSHDRGGAPFLWVAVHTAEGPTDSMPADPALDSESAQELLRYFQRADVRASSHAIADEEDLLDNLVPYSRASWTLRGGNEESDNLELCGMAGWSRATWLAHPGLLRNCARWIASRCKARGMPIRYIGTAGVQARAKGVIGHVNYTEGTGDGTHWDPGPGFPWDVVIQQAQTGGVVQPEGVFMALSDAEQADLYRIAVELEKRVEHTERMVAASAGQSAARDAAQLAATTSAKDAILAGLKLLNPADLSDADVQRLGAAIADQIPSLEADAVIDALGQRITEPAA